MPPEVTVIPADDSACSSPRCATASTAAGAYLKSQPDPTMACAESLLRPEMARTPRPAETKRDRTAASRGRARRKDLVVSADLGGSCCLPVAPIRRLPALTD